MWLLQICKTCCDLRHQFKNPNFFATLLAISLKCSFHIRFESLSTLSLSMFSNSSLTTMTMLLLFVVLNLDMKLTCVSCFKFGKDFFPNLIILTNIWVDALEHLILTVVISSVNRPIPNLVDSTDCHRRNCESNFLEFQGGW